MLKLLASFVGCAIIIATPLSTNAFMIGNDTENAQYLGNNGIIVEQENSNDYRLDDAISRAEAVGTALKLIGAELPDDYSCNSYYADVTSDGWICRAVEIAADRGIVTRSNAEFRPQDQITRSEAVAIIMNAKNIKVNNFAERGAPFEDIEPNSWQYPLIYAAIEAGIVSPMDMKFYPDRNATRAEFFGFIRWSIERANIVYTHPDLNISIRHTKTVQNFYTNEVTPLIIKSTPNSAILTTPDEKERLTIHIQRTDTWDDVNQFMEDLYWEKWNVDRDSIELENNGIYTFRLGCEDECNGYWANIGWFSPEDRMSYHISLGHEPPFIYYYLYWILDWLSFY